MNQHRSDQSGALRYSNKPLPPYRHRLGVTPHPVRDPKGHLFGKDDSVSEPFLADQWWKNEEYLYGVDLYNFGFYWEAHEAWESLWKSTRKGSLAWIFLRGLIQISAALLKREQKRWRGVQGLSHSGLARLKKVCEKQSEYCGISLPNFLERLDDFFSNVPDTAPAETVCIHLNFPDGKLDDLMGGGSG